MPSKPKKTAKKTTSTKTKAVTKTTPSVPKEQYGDFLNQRDELIAKYLSEGKTEEEVMAIFKANKDEMEYLRKNPTFVKYYNDRVVSKGMADRMNRLASEKRIADAINEEIMRRLANDEDDELQKTKLATLLRMRHESFDKIQALMGENAEKQNQNTMVLIMDRIKQNSSIKIADAEQFNPADEFPVIDVQSEEI